MTITEAGERRVLRNAAVLSAARVVDRIGGLVVALLLSRHAGAEGLGVYVAIIAFFQLIALAGEMGASNLLIREIARHPEQTGRYVWHALVLAGAGSLAAAVGIWVIVPHLGLSDEMRVGLAIVAIAILPATWNVVCQAVFVARQRVELETIATVVSTILTIGISALLLVRGHGAVAMIVVFVGIKAIVTVFYLVMIHRSIAPVEAHFDRSFARHLLRDMRPFAGSSIVGGLFARPEVLILSLVSSPALVGYYGAALKAVELWQFLPQTYMVSAFPVLTRAYHDGGARAPDIERRATTSLLALGIPVSVALIVAAEPIIRTLYGTGFDDAVTPLRIMAVSAALYCTHSVLWRSLSARGEQSKVLRIQVVTLVLRVAGGILLVVLLGAIGAAISVAAGLALHNSLLGRAARHGRRSIIDPRQIWPFLTAAVVMGAALVVAARRGVALPGLVVIGLATYAGVAAALVRLWGTPGPSAAIPLLVSSPEETQA